MLVVSFVAKPMFSKNDAIPNSYSSNVISICSHFQQMPRSADQTGKQRENRKPTVISGITAPATIDATIATTIIANSFQLAYRNNAKYPTVNLGASICLWIISFSCSLSPAIGVEGFTSSAGSPCFSSSIATLDDDAGDRVVIIETFKLSHLCTVVVHVGRTKKVAWRSGELSKLAVKKGCNLS
jgi:hypothetical protein